MWIDIFKGGRQIDSRGRTHDGDRYVDAAVATFDEKTHRPPLVLGHPDDNSPAYGWVQGVKSEVIDGVKTLFVDIAPVEPLKQWVNGKLYQNRSAAFYADGRLRHVGFLGGSPPAVKGLAPLPAFADDAGSVIEFMDSYQQGLMSRVLRRLREHFIEKEGGDVADRLLPDWEIEEIGRVPDEPEAAVDNSLSLYTETPTKGGSMKFSEFMNAINIFKKMGGTDADIDAIAPIVSPAQPATGPAAATFSEADLRAAEQKAKEKAAAEFAETRRQEAKQARDAEIITFCEKLKTDGKLPPAWVDKGLAGFMQSLEAEQTVAFSEAGQKQTPLKFFKSLLEELGTSPLFAEIATRERAGASRQEADADKKLGEEIAAKVG